MHPSLTRRLEFVWETLPEFPADDRRFANPDDNDEFRLLRYIVDYARRQENGAKARLAILDAQNQAYKLYQRTEIRHFLRLHNLLHECYNESVQNPY